MAFDEPKSVCFLGGTPFVVAITRIYGFCHEVGDWGSPGQHFVRTEDAELIRQLLEGDGIKFSTRHEYVHEGATITC